MDEEKKKPLLNVMESLLEFAPEEIERNWYKLLEQSIKELKNDKN